MAFGGFGANILTEHVDQARARKQAKQLGAGLHLVMSDNGNTGLAKNIKQDSPEATVVFRPYHQDDRRWQDFKSAEEIYDIHGRYGDVGDGLVVQVGNEGGYSPNLVSKYAKVADYFKTDNKRCAVPSYAVGNPSEADVDGGNNDALIRAISGDKRALPNLFSVHEYAEEDTFAEQLYRIGRLTRFIDRAKAIGAPLDPQKIAVLEYGRDKGGNATQDGWRVKFGNDQLKFFIFMKPGLVLYKKLGILGACVYCMGDTWPSFDWQTALDLIQYMTDWNAANVILGVPVTQPTQPVPIPTVGGIPSTLTKMPSTNVNVRTDPVNGTDVGDLLKGDICTVYPPSNGWVYQTVIQSVPRTGTFQAAHDGWVSLQSNAVGFTPLPPVLPNPVMEITPKQYADLTTYRDGISRILLEVKPVSGGGGF